MGSEHGTWLGVVRLEVYEPRALSYHEIFRIGPYHLRLEPLPVAVLPQGAAETVLLVTSVSASQLARSPIEPLVEQNSGPWIDVQLTTPEVSVMPGTLANVSLLITQNPAADRFQLTLSGIARVVQTLTPAFSIY